MIYLSERALPEVWGRHRNRKVLMFNTLERMLLMLRYPKKRF